MTDDGYSLSPGERVRVRASVKTDYSNDRSPKLFGKESAGGGGPLPAEPVSTGESVGLSPAGAGEGGAKAPGEGRREETNPCRQGEGER